MAEFIHSVNILGFVNPPSIPDETFKPEYEELFRVKNWKRETAAVMLAALMTLPAFHANGIRLDWLQRLVLAKAEGKRRPKRNEFSAALNHGLREAGVLQLEDPIEDLFCDIVATKRGNFRVFPGQWETAGPYTQTLLTAFEKLHESQLKTDALEAVYSILEVSEVIAERSKVDRQTVSGGEPNGDFRVPGDATITRITSRVKLTNKFLEDGVSRKRH